MKSIETINEITISSKDYELIDFGDGEKLERFGKYLLRRPDPQALAKKRLGVEVWRDIDAKFERTGEKGEWNMVRDIEDKWLIDFGNQKMWIRPTAFKHVGLFPEQVSNWQWMQDIIKPQKDQREINVLNLFAYTGGASLACAQAGAKVTHIDSSKVAVTWGRENAEASHMEDMPIRWIVEDVRKFVEREIKRESKYDAIIMDPPAFGHGANNELWKIEDDLLPLISDCKRLLSQEPIFFLINGYSAGYSALAYRNNLIDLIEKYGGSLESGELALGETAQKGEATRVLPCGIFARWQK
jgi:23S rRNA (cytosine1962-C5)-methyltransferase